MQLDLNVDLQWTFLNYPSIPENCQKEEKSDTMIIIVKKKS